MSRPPERLRPMKLPTNRLRPLKLQKNKPVKRVLKRLVPSALRSALKAPATKVAEGSDSAAKTFQTVKGSKGVKLAMHLILVKPWVLLIGFWLVSMIGGTLALEGMLSPKKLTMALPEDTVEVEATPDQQVQVSQTSDEIAGEATADSTELPVVNEAAGSSFPVLPLATFVGACAAGCLVMSRRRAMMRHSAARAKGRVRKRSRTGATAGSAHSVTGQQSSQRLVRKPAKSAIKATASSGASSTSASRMKTAATKSSATKPSAPKSPATKSPAKAASTSVLRPKKRRQRTRKAAHKSAPNASGSRVLASRATAQKASAQPAEGSKKSSRRASARSASRHQPVVSVVPAGESNALDWNQPSLAHQMDVRHRKAM